MKKVSRFTVLFLAATLILSSFSFLSVVAEEPEFHEVVNFTASESRAGYLMDIGEVFGDRGNGYKYGWNIDHSDAGRIATDRVLDRSRGKEASDHRLTTLSHFHEGAEWTIELPNGTYEVTLAVGDLWFGLPDSEDPYVLNVNGEEVFSFVDGVDGDDFNTEDDFFFETVTVEVSDGQIVLDNGESDNNKMKINYITIEEPGDSEDALDLTVNFMPGEERAGYRYDFGQVFGDRGNGLAYGWNSDHSDAGRIATDRALDPSHGKEVLDHRLTTLSHFEEEATWSIDVPNGTYEVTVAIGDLWFGLPDRDDVYGLNINGEEVISFENGVDGDDFVSDDDFFFETVTVEVTDGQIVLDNGDADKNDVKINYIEIASIALADAGDAGDDGVVEDTNDDGAVAQPDMPKTGLGGAGNGNGAVLIALLFVSAMVVVVIRKRNGNQA